jgi:hypothetical protein
MRTSLGEQILVIMVRKRPIAQVLPTTNDAKKIKFFATKG